MKVLSLFDGCSGARQALKELGVCPERYIASETDKFAIKVSRKNFSDIIHIGDINGIDHNVNKLHGPFDLIIGGFPCFKAGTLILTDKGNICIESLKVGDRVLTHTNTFKKVTAIGSTEANLYEVKAQGIETTYTTANHPYYVRTKVRKWNTTTKSYDTYLRKSCWRSVKNLTGGDRVAIPINSESKNYHDLTAEDCWILGRYVADGYLKSFRKSSQTYANIVLCIGKNKINEVKDNIVEHDYKHSEELNIFRVTLKDPKLLSLCVELGRGAENKRLCSWVDDLPVELLRNFITGYMSGDGCYIKDKGMFSATTVSRVLAHNLCRAISKAYSVPVRLYKNKRPKTHIIEGRIVNQKDTYIIRYVLDESKKVKAVVEDGFVWLPIKKITETKTLSKVYNLTVEADNSYCANNAVVHNCQDMSICKNNRQGLSGARSGLFWKMANLIECLKPKYFLVENVNSMSKESKKVITEVLGVEPILINSALVTAQHRKRLYWTNIPGITQPQDKGVFLKDIIEEGFVDRNKAHCLDANYAKGVSLEYYLKKSRRQVVFNTDNNTKYMLVPASASGKTSPIKFLGGIVTGKRWLENGKDFSRNFPRGNRVYSPEGKTPTLNANGGGLGAKTGLYLTNTEEPPIIRKLIPIECERLQGLEDNYTEGVSNTQRYKMIGNAFTIPVVAHILSFMKVS